MMKQAINIEQFDKNYYFSCDRPESVTPDAFNLFQFYDAYFFQNTLEACEVKWSKRMTLCAGTCKHASYNSCTITLSESLLQYRNSNELKETLIHEMIHAFLFLTNPKACLTEGGHGEEFKSLMTFINSVTGLNITVYHSFIDEVESFRKHVWKCDGPCQNQHPYYGVCKRQMNRPPQKSDSWFEDHQKNCGGQFIKIDGPEFGADGKPDPSKQVVKKTKKEKVDASSSKAAPTNKKQQKGGSKTDNLQSLISKFLISTPEQSNQSTNNNVSLPNKSAKPEQNNFVRQQSTKDKDGSFSLDDFKFQKEKSNTFSSIKDIKNQQNTAYPIQKIQNVQSPFRNNQTQTNRQQNNITQQNNNNSFNNQNGGSTISNPISIYSNSSSNINNFNNKNAHFNQNENKSATNYLTENNQFNSLKNITDKLSLKDSQKQVEEYFYSNNNYTSLGSNENVNQQTHLREQDKSLNEQQQSEDEDYFKKSTLSKVQIQIAFTRDKQYNKESNYIYLMNANYNLLDISNFIQNLYQTKYQLKHIIREEDGRDEKIDNYPQLSLINLNEQFQLLFDFGNLKINLKELTRVPLQNFLFLSTTQEKAIKEPQLQQKA